MEKRNCVKLPDARFVLMDKCGNEIACGTTNDRGEIEFDCLPLGTYYVKEIQAPCGYERCDECIEVTICPAKPLRCVDVFNEQVKGGIRITKFGYRQP
ncbi:MAG: prealbumin-like fold domain-containing protein [Clostridiales bacterium]|nr:prealbumin-like fold domain-containing protein [Clostridiales bacterium]